MGINMSAGQTMMSTSCLKALGTQMEEPIYYPNYWALEEETAEYLKMLIGTENEIIIMSGSATFGEEAAIRSILAKGDKIVVLNTGVFGQVAVDLLEISGCVAVEVKLPYGALPDLDVIEKALDSPGVKGLFVVHHETSTGSLYRLKDLGMLTRKKGLLFFVDAISSIGGVPFKMDEWGVDVLFTSPQKCICGPQGIAIIVLSPPAWDKVNSNSRKDISLCLDLKVWLRYRQKKVRAMLEAWRSGTQEPVIEGLAKHEPTPSGPLVRGLHGALMDLFDEGLENVWLRNSLSAMAVRSAAVAMGLKLVSENEKIVSPMVTVFYLPDKIYEKDFRERMLKKWGIAIGNGEIGRDNVRIGTMGLSAQPRYVLPTIAALEDILMDFGHTFTRGVGVNSAVDVINTRDEVDWNRIR